MLPEPLVNFARFLCPGLHPGYIEPHPCLPTVTNIHQVTLIEPAIARRRVVVPIQIPLRCGVEARSEWKSKARLRTYHYIVAVFQAEQGLVKMEELCAFLERVVIEI